MPINPDQLFPSAEKTLQGKDLEEFRNARASLISAIYAITLEESRQKLEELRRRLAGMEDGYDVVRAMRRIVTRMQEDPDEIRRFKDGLKHDLAA